MDINFAKVTQAVLDDNGWTEVKLASELGVSQPSVNRLKTGETKEPYYALGKKLMDIYERQSA